MRIYSNMHAKLIAKRNVNRKNVHCSKRNGWCVLKLFHPFYLTFTAGFSGLATISRPTRDQSAIVSRSFSRQVTKRVFTHLFTLTRISPFPRPPKKPEKKAPTPRLSVLKASTLCSPEGSVCTARGSNPGRPD